MRTVIRVLSYIIAILMSFSRINANASMIKCSDSDDITLEEFIQSSHFFSCEEGNYYFSLTYPISYTNSNSKSAKYAKEIVAIIPTDDISRENISTYIKGIRSGGSGTIDKYDWDSSGSIIAHLIINYDLSTVDNVDYIRLTSVSGSHSGPNSGVTIKGQSCTYGCIGYYPGGYQSNASASLTPTTNSWSVSIPSTWHAVYKDSSSNVGANYTVTVGRGNSTWSIYIVNNV